MGRYILRSVKYFVLMCVFVVALLWLKVHYNQLPISLGDYVWLYLHGTNGMMAAVMIVVLALTYPRFGFTKREVAGSMERHRTQLLNAMELAGYVLQSEANGVMVFRGTLLVRLGALGEERIEVRQVGEHIELSGLRRTTVRIAARLDSYIQNYERANG